MARFYPFLFAMVATVLAVVVGFVFMRTHSVEPKAPEMPWRRLFGRPFEKAAEALEKEATE